MKTKITILILILIGLSSCENFFDYNFDVEPLVVVNCLLKANDTIFVDLSYTKKEMMNFEKIENAEVFIYEDNKFKEKLTYTKEGEYKSLNFIPHEEKNYSLKVKVPNYDTIIANTFIPKLIELDTLTHFFVAGVNPSDGDGDWENTFLRFSDNININNFYIYISNLGNEYSKDPIFNDVIKTKYTRWWDFAYFDDNLFNGQTYNISMNYYYEGWPPDTLFQNFEFGTISEDMYLYVKSKDEQSYAIKSDNNYFMEPVLIYSNITNGVGIFAGYATKEYEYVFVKP